MQAYFDQFDRKIELGRQIGQGGEAVAYESFNDSKLVVKIYHEPADQLKSEKLQAMAKISHSDIVQFAAWPFSIVRKTKGGPVTGVIMPKVVGVEIHKLYNPSSRKTSFPSADWRFLIRTASNFATAVETLHQHGIVIGDINQGNALVSDDATVRFIDCDSFQIKTGNRIFRCPVGVPHFTPPELQTGRFDDKDRTMNHDRFGLAIMVFHLLFAGRHPFAGRYSGPTDPSLEEKIKDYRFAFGRNSKQFHVEPPPFTPLLSDILLEVSELFESAFRKGSESGGRPTAASWRDALKRFEKALVQCPDDPGHFYLSGKRCPWCRIAGQGGPNIFLSVSFARMQNQLSAFDPHAIAEAIKNVRVDLGSSILYNRSKLVFVPHSAKNISSQISTEANLFLKLMTWVCLTGSILLYIFNVSSGAAVFAFATAALLVILAYVNRNYFAENILIAKSNLENEIRIKNLNSELLRKIKEAENRIQQEKDAVVKQLKKLKALDNDRENAFRQLESQAEQRQLEEYLSSFLICDAKIPGIGLARVSTLESYGIDSAIDIQAEKLEQIPGFGGHLIATLLAWKNLVERDFRFDRSKGVPSRDRQSIDHKYNQQKLRLQKILMQSPQELKKLRDTQIGLIQRFIRAEGLE